MHTEWTSTKDKLPEINGTYVCFMEDGHDDVGCFQGFFRIATFTKSFGDHGRFYSRFNDITNDVAYWLLLPALSKS